MIALRPLLWACALGLGACASAPVAPTAGGPAASVAGTRWVGIVPAAADARMLPRLEFAPEGRLNGFTGCNMLSGTWRMEGNEVRFGAIMATKRMCLGDPGEVEQRVLAALSDRSRAVREGRKLVVVAPGGERFEYAEAGAS